MLVLRKADEQFVCIYRDEYLADLLKTLCRWAVDKELSFTWFDAAVLSQKARDAQTPP